MDKLTSYRNLIKKILTEYEQLASQTPNPSGVDSVLAFDEQRDQYIWFQVGWHDDKKLLQLLFMFALKMRRFTLRKIGLKKESLLSY